MKTLQKPPEGTSTYKLDEDDKESSSKKFFSGQAFAFLGISRFALKKLGLEKNRQGNAKMNQINLSINQVAPLPADKEKATQILLKELEGIWLSKVVKSAHTPFRSNQSQSFAFRTFQDLFDEAIGRGVAEKGVLNLAGDKQRQLFPENAAKGLKISPEGPERKD